MEEYYPPLCEYLPLENEDILCESFGGADPEDYSETNYAW